MLRAGNISSVVVLALVGAAPMSAAPYCRRAIEIAEGLVEADPEELEWRRALAFSFVLRGRLAFGHERFQRALDSFDRASEIRSDLSRRDPGNVFLKTELARNHGWLANCCQKLKEYERSIEHAGKAHRLHTELLDSNPQRVESTVEMARAEVWLSLAYLGAYTPTRHAKIAELLDSAERRLIALQVDGRDAPVRRDVRRLLEGVGRYRRALDERASKQRADAEATWADPRP